MCTYKQITHTVSRLDNTMDNRSRHNNIIACNIGKVGQDSLLRLGEGSLSIKAAHTRVSSVTVVKDRLTVVIDR